MQLCRSTTLCRRNFHLEKPFPFPVQQQTSSLPRERSRSLPEAERNLNIYAINCASSLCCCCCCCYCRSRCFLCPFARRGTRLKCARDLEEGKMQMLGPICNQRRCRMAQQLAPLRLAVTFYRQKQQRNCFWLAGDI